MCKNEGLKGRRRRRRRRKERGGGCTLPLRPWESFQSFLVIDSETPIRLFFTTLFFTELRPCLPMSIFLILFAWTVVLMLLLLLQVTASVRQRGSGQSGVAKIFDDTDMLPCSRSA